MCLYVASQAGNGLVRGQPGREWPVVWPARQWAGVWLARPWPPRARSVASQTAS